MIPLMIAIGAAVGAPARYLTDRAIQSRHETVFPWGTLTVNLTASLILARDVVRSVNSGNETVPTVRVGSRSLSNPSWRQLAPLLGEGPWQRSPSSTTGHWMTAVLSWSPFVLFVIISLVLTFTGHDGVAWGAGGLAVASWWVTRRLRT